MIKWKSQKIQRNEGDENKQQKFNLRLKTCLKVSKKGKTINKHTHRENQQILLYFLYCI